MTNLSKIFVVGLFALIGVYGGYYFTYPSFTGTVYKINNDEVSLQDLSSSEEKTILGKFGDNVKTCYNIVKENLSDEKLILRVWYNSEIVPNRITFNERINFGDDKDLEIYCGEKDFTIKYPKLLNYKGNDPDDLKIYINEYKDLKEWHDLTFQYYYKTWDDLQTNHQQSLNRYIVANIELVLGWIATHHLFMQGMGRF